MRRFIEGVQSQGRIELVDGSSPFLGAGVSRDGVKDVFRMLRAAFPDHDAVVLDLVAEGDRVMTYKTFNGTNQGEFMGIPATGRPERIRVMDIVRLADGRIA